MTHQLQNIVIVGGGTAGWITAGTLAATITRKYGADHVNITVIESPHIPTIGVGEGTWPTMRSTLANMGISEYDFIRQCNATFKQGSTFVGWLKGIKQDCYYHPFSLPADFIKTNLAWHWMHNDRSMPFAELVCPQPVVCQHALAPKLATSPEFAGYCNYGYHLDAGAFSAFLKDHCINKLAVKHIIDDVIQINSIVSDNVYEGDIKSVTTKDHGDIGADLFIDCTGQKALLIGGHLKVPFISQKETLFIDSALAVHVPTNPTDTIASTTFSTAQSAGWIWDITLQNRRGIGHVYASEYVSEIQAKQELINYLQTLDCPNLDIKALDIRKIRFEPGHRALFWKNNCVAVGLSAGFVEPLEASSLALVELSAKMIAEQLPVNRQAMTLVAQKFNALFLHRWQSVIDFLKLHYVLSQRTDSAFWQDNQDEKSIPESLKNRLAVWQHQPPWHHDFEQVEVFPSASYQYILTGMQFKTQMHGFTPSLQQEQIAVAHYNDVQTQTGNLLKQLPDHRALIQQLFNIT
ncbi:tryptophan halogenase family protein [Algibacillus agarilyticus]|uniref:tryptophan halogenase family protein n=1 Tax=Algibacillus agarilyticus TaxID=2234133 RepID=UPI000DD0BA3C|nr:tryptophan halogenase family protein [Algibacillus agarilyticus]